MNWNINKTYKWGNYRYHVFLKADKAFNYNTFAFPTIWTGYISADHNNVGDSGKQGNVELIQVSYKSFDKDSKYPVFANGIYQQVIDDIDRELKIMD